MFVAELVAGSVEGTNRVGQDIPAPSPAGLKIDLELGIANALAHHLEAVCNDQPMKIGGHEQACRTIGKRADQAMEIRVLIDAMGISWRREP